MRVSILLHTLAFASYALADTFTASHEQTRPRSLKEDSFQFSITGTQWQVRGTYGSQVNSSFYGPFIGAFKANISSLAPDVSFQQYNVLPWNAKDPSNDFHGLFQVTKACDELVLDVKFVTDLYDAFATFLASAEPYSQYALAGTIGPVGQPGFYGFRLNQVPDYVLNTEKQANVVLGANDLDALNQVKKELLNATTPDDLLVFVGNTAGYLYYTFKISDQRNIKLLPISGNPYPRGGLAPTDEMLSSFNTNVLSSIFQNQPSGRVVFIDHVRSGETLSSLIHFCGSLGHLISNAYYVNIAYAMNYERYVVNVPNAINLRTIQMPDNLLEPLDLGWIARLLPYYVRELWFVPPDEVRNPDEEWADRVITTLQTMML